MPGDQGQDPKIKKTGTKIERKESILRDGNNNIKKKKKKKKINHPIF